MKIFNFVLLIKEKKFELRQKKANKKFMQIILWEHHDMKFRNWNPFLRRSRLCCDNRNSNQRTFELLLAYFIHFLPENSFVKHVKISLKWSRDLLFAMKERQMKMKIREKREQFCNGHRTHTQPRPGHVVENFFNYCGASHPKLPTSNHTSKELLISISSRLVQKAFEYKLCYGKSRGRKKKHWNT